MSKAGIDYGRGLSNIDWETGIRYGVIHQNEISPESFDDIIHNGIDVDFQEYRRNLSGSLECAIKESFDNFGLLNRGNSPAEIAEDIVDNLEWDGYEGTGDFTRYEYEEDGYKLQTCRDGDIFVLKSKYVTQAPYCSPCAPGACYLTDGENDKSLPLAYCLGVDWFDEYRPCPYPIWELDGMKLVYEPKKTEECNE